VKIAIGTRFFGKDPDKDLPRLDKWAEGAISVTDPELISIAINSAEDKADTAGFLAKKYPTINAIPVTPWGKFVFPLNVLIAKASSAHADAFLITSAEYPPSKKAVDALASHLKRVDGDHTLVVGARIPEHAFRKGSIDHADGTQVPYNTYALYSPLIYRLGVPLIGDNPGDPANAGVEELTTILLYQEFYAQVTAKLLDQVPGIPSEINTAGWDEERHSKHRAKMASKASRPAEQLKVLKHAGPRVIHI
jgi:hypothetical protein